MRDPRRAEEARTLIARLVRFELEGGQMVLDCLGEPTLPYGDESRFGIGEPFSLMVETPGHGWLYGALSALIDWSDDNRYLSMVETTGEAGARVKLSDGRTTVAFVLIAVSGHGNGHPRGQP